MKIRDYRVQEVTLQPSFEVTPKRKAARSNRAGRAKRGCEEKEDQFLLDFTAPCFLVKNSETRKKRKQPPPRGATSIFMQKIATLPPGVGSVCYRICRGYVQ